MRLRSLIQPGSVTVAQVRKNRTSVKRVVIVVSLILTIVLLKIFLVEPLKIDGIALEPALRNGDRVLVIKRIATVSRGDIVLFSDPRKPSILIVERVVGLPGETIQLREGLLYIDGKQSPEPYVSEEHNLRRSSTDEVEIPTDSYFMLGDNRDEAFDSRKMGPIRRQLIYGKFWVRYWPLKSR